MNYVKDKTQLMNCWNKKLQDTLAKEKLSQEELAQKLKALGENNPSQQLVSRWMHVGEENTENGKTFGFPSFLNMYNTAQILGVDLGYLIGETNYKTFDAEHVADYTGLNEATIDAISNLTHHQSITAKHSYHNTGDMLGLLIQSNRFRDFLDCLIKLDETFHQSTKAERISELNKKYGKQQVSQASNYIDFIEDAPAELVEIVKALEDNIDQDYAEDLQKENNSTIARYNLQLAFNRIIDELYPEEY